MSLLLIWQQRRSATVTQPLDDGDWAQSFGAASGPVVIETGGEFVPLVSAAATFNPANGFDWSEQPQAWADPQTFAPDASTEGFPPILPDWQIIDDGQQSRSLDVAAFAPDASVEGFVPRAPAPNHPDFGYDAQTDRDQSVTWFAPDASVESPAPPVIGDVAWDVQQAIDRTTVWFAPEACEWTPIPALTQATPAQDAGLWQEQPGQERSLDVVWYQPEDDTFAQFPSIPTGTVASVAQQAALWPEQPGQERSLDVVWFAPDAAVEGFPPRTAQPFQPGFGWDATFDRDLSVVWYQPDTGSEFVPLAGAELTGLWTPDQPYPAAVDATPAPDSVEGLTPPTTGPSAAQLAGLWQDQPQAWADPQTFASEPMFSGFVPQAPAPNLPDFGYDSQQDRDQSVTWYQPDTGAEFVRFISVATVPQQAGLWADDHQQDRSTEPLWFAPDPEASFPFTNAGTVVIGGAAPTGNASHPSVSGFASAQIPSGDASGPVPSGIASNPKPSTR